MFHCCVNRVVLSMSSSDRTLALGSYSALWYLTWCCRMTEHMQSQPYIADWSLVRAVVPKVRGLGPITDVVFEQGSSPRALARLARFISLVSEIAAPRESQA